MAEHHAGRLALHPFALADGVAWSFGVLEGEARDHIGDLRAAGRRTLAELAVLVEARRTLDLRLAAAGGTGAPSDAVALDRAMDVVRRAALLGAEDEGPAPAPRRRGPRPTVEHRARDRVVMALAFTACRYAASNEEKWRAPASAIAEVCRHRYGLTVTARAVATIVDAHPICAPRGGGDEGWGAEWERLLDQLPIDQLPDIGVSP